MKIRPENVRVREGDKGDLAIWPTNVEPVCKSKNHHKELLEEHVEKLSALQRLHYASNRYAALKTLMGLPRDTSRCTVRTDR